MRAARPLRLNPALVGRAAELARLQAAAEAAARGQGYVVTVTGEPGIGKSRLLEEFAGRVRSSAQVLEGRCSYAEGAPPYYPWVQVIAGYAGAVRPAQLRRVLGEHSPAIAEVVKPIAEALGEVAAPLPLEHPGSARFRFFQSVAAVLGRAAEERTLVVLLHDLHWVDSPSAALLAHLLGEIETARLLLVMSYRDRPVGADHPLRPALAQLARVPGHDHLALQGLSRSEVQELLAAAVSREVPAAVADLVHRTTGGVPLFVRELARTLHREGRLGSHGEEGGGPTGVPASIRDLVGGWLQQLSPRSREAVCVAAAIGMDFAVDVLAACCAEPAELLMQLVEEAVALSLLDPGEPGQFRFSHSMVRESILANLSAPRRAQVHARIAEGLERRYGVEAAGRAAQLAHHFGAAGGLVGADRAVRYALLAAEQAISRHAYEDAVQLLQPAIPMEVDAGTRARLLFGLARARIALNQREEAVDLLTESFELSVQAGDVGGAVSAAEYPLVVSFRRGGVAELSQKALALVDPGSLQAGRLECQRGLALAQEERDYGEARRCGERAVELARSHGDRQLEARSLLLAAFIEREEQNLGPCLQRSLEALEISRRIPDLQRITASHHLAQEALIARGDFGQGRRHAEEGLAAAEKVQDRYWLMLACAANHRYRIALGDWRGARDFSDRGLALAPRDPFLLANRARLEYETGNPGPGETWADRYVQLLKREVETVSDRESHQHASVASVLPLICRLAGPGAWMDLAETAARALLDSPRASAEWRFRAASCLGLIAAAGEDAAGARECYRRFEGLLHRDPENVVVFCRGSLTFVQAQLGRIAHAAGDLDRAIGHFEAAGRDCRAAGHHPELAWIGYDYANALLAAGRPGGVERAAALLDESARLADRLGMAPLGEKIAALRSAAAHPSLPGGLTSRELEVLVLLARGRTNKEIAAELFIAERTASNHVSNILARIKCGNRTEAAAFAHRHGLVKP